MGYGRGPQCPVQGRPCCAAMCPPWDAALVALRLLGQQQGYHNLIFLPPCWGWIQPWNGCVGSMKEPCSAVVVIPDAPRLTQDFCLLCSSLNQTLSATVTCLLRTAGGRESCRVLDVEIWVIS